MANEQNLIPAKKGEVRNPNGRPKGVKNWHTIVQDILGDEELFQALLDSADRRPDWVEKLNKKNGATAIVAVMTLRALEGDKQAAEWLRKTGFGDKLDLSSSDGTMTPTVIIESSYAGKPKFRVTNDTPPEIT